MRPMNWKTCFAAVIAFALSVPAFAGNCSWTTTPTAMAFGTYSVFATSDLPGSTKFVINCTPHTHVNVKISAGSAGTFVPNRLMSGVAKYNLFLDAGGSAIWGDTAAAGVTYDAYNTTPANKDITDFVYGIMPKNQDLTPGTYNDTVSVTLSYGPDVGALTNTLTPITMAVSATVNAECRVDTFGLSFGTYDPTAVGGISATSAVKVYCTKTTSITSAVLSSATFKMSSPTTTDLLTYTASMTLPGSLASTTSTAPIGGVGGFAITGAVAAGQDVGAGAYQDSLQATINY